MLVNRHEYDFVVDAMELDEVDRLQMSWICIVDGINAIVIVAVVSTLMKDE